MSFVLHIKKNLTTYVFLFQVATQSTYTEIKCPIDSPTASIQSGAALISLYKTRLLQNRLNPVLFMKAGLRLVYRCSRANALHAALLQIRNCTVTHTRRVLC